MPNDCENSLRVTAANIGSQPSDLEYWYETHAGIKTIVLPIESRHAYLMGASNTAVPRLADDCPEAMKTVPRDVNQYIFALAAVKHVPENLSGRSGRSEELSFKYATDYKEGRADWHNWQSKHWGTKWDAYETEVRRDGTSITYDFCTAWSPPVPWLATAAAFCHAQAPVGQRVVLSGLSREELNGRRGRALEYVASKQRYMVRLDDEPATTKPLGVKRGNLKLAVGRSASRDLPSLLLELTFGDISMNFSGRVRFDAGVMTSQDSGDYGEYHGDYGDLDTDDSDGAPDEASMDVGDA